MGEQHYKELSEAQSYCVLAAGCLSGINSKINIPLAINYLNKAAELGLNEARYQLGVIYSDGKNLPQDLNQAVKWFTLAAEHDFVPAKFALSTLYFHQKEFKKASKLLHELAELDIAEAETNLADLYLSGKEGVKDVKKAIELLTRAANKGDRLAQYRLGELYYKGMDVATNYLKARKYLVLALEQNYLPAYLVMGSMLEHGYGITKDVIRAYSFYYFCHSSGMPNLSDLLSDVFSTLDDVEKQQAKFHAEEFCKNEPSPV